MLQKKRNWDLFYNSFLDDRIPIILCITGRPLETASKDSIWIRENSEIIDKLGFISKSNQAHRTILRSIPLIDIDDMFKDYYIKLRNKSYNEIHNLMKIIIKGYFNPIDEFHWTDIFKKMINTIVGFLGLNINYYINITLKELLIKLGFNDKEAEEISNRYDKEAEFIERRIQSYQEEVDRTYEFYEKLPTMTGYDLFQMDPELFQLALDDFERKVDTVGWDPLFEPTPEQQKEEEFIKAALDLRSLPELPN